MKTPWKVWRSDKEGSGLLSPTSAASLSAYGYQSHTTHDHDNPGRAVHEEEQPNGNDEVFWQSTQHESLLQRRPALKEVMLPRWTPIKEVAAVLKVQQRQGKASGDRQDTKAKQLRQLTKQVLTMFVENDLDSRSEVKPSASSSNTTTASSIVPANTDKSSGNIEDAAPYAQQAEDKASADQETTEDEYDCSQYDDIMLTAIEQSLAVPLTPPPKLSQPPTTTTLHPAPLAPIAFTHVETSPELHMDFDWSDPSLLQLGSQQQQQQQQGFQDRPQRESVNEEEDDDEYDRISESWVSTLEEMDLTQLASSKDLRVPFASNPSSPSPRCQSPIVNTNTMKRATLISGKRRIPTRTNTK